MIKERAGCEEKNGKEKLQKRPTFSTIHPLSNTLSEKLFLAIPMIVTHLMLVIRFPQRTCNDVFMLMKDIHIRSQDYYKITIRRGGFWQIQCNRWTSAK
jgi:hypothetical protein